ncbi:Phosphate uptake regulator [Desulfonatronum thiosulfatophilum]|uniref:Phosphate uptake regulator n=1 Tax=Desulfonatronum thiosulfatophilum TaxID=617002 RepID=A0A1G6AJF5_9BACT|nr:phosphate uptake regulator PhoU [Desulfonatronum thiosulfatophilum]SDB08489.1 Phosphate uptake regulator [Desulfonatronum thiosulfatophilum]
MHSLEGLEQKIQFMVLEVSKQVDDTLKVLIRPDNSIIEKIASRDDYIDNFKSVIENTCFSRLHSQAHLDKTGIDFIRAVNIISNNLERISDFSVDIARQLRYISDHRFLDQFEYRPFFRQILGALDIVVRSLFHRDLSLALRICRAEFVLDKLYKHKFDRIIAQLQSGKETHNLITTLFIFRYLERMGDSLLNIGEAVIFSVVGEKLKINQYQALRESLDNLDFDLRMRDVDFESIWGTRSGCRIGKVTNGAQSNATGVIFKEGKLKKILQEKANIQQWETIFPGLTPKVFGFQESMDNASILLEFLTGCTFQEIVFNDDPEQLENAFFLVQETAAMIWQNTLRKGSKPCAFTSQLFSRLEDVFVAHPELNTPRTHFCGLELPATEELLAELAEVERELTAPFTVFTHGDYNINNIIYNQKEQRVHYIDVHRSKLDDYVQDVSVFLVSNFRIPIFEGAVRNNLNQVGLRFLQFARQFAKEHHDATFEIRLALGLIRSFITSARFELNAEFAAGMFARGVYLAEKILAYRGRPWERFQVPVQILQFRSF